MKPGTDRRQSSLNQGSEATLAASTSLPTPTKKVAVTGDENTEIGAWHVYILRCRDDSLYTGITTDIERRLNEHNHLASGASYTRGRRPVTLVYSRPMHDRSAASREEWRIKKLSRQDKEAMVKRVSA